MFFILNNFLKSVLRLKMSGKAVHKKMGDKSTLEQQKALHYKAFSCCLDPPCMDLGGFLILKEIKNIEI